MAEQSDFDAGVAGASARREHERRRSNREQRIRGAHPQMGGLILALSDEPQHQRAWSRGGEGEELVAASLAKRYQGKIAVQRPLFGKSKLTIADRDRSKLIDGLDKQVTLVRSALEAIASDAPVHGVLCIVDADLPMFGTLTFRGYPLLYRKALAKRLNTAGPVDATQARELAEALGRHFPPA